VFSSSFLIIIMVYNNHIMRLPFLWIAAGFTSGIIFEKYVTVSCGFLLGIFGAGMILLLIFRGRKISLPLFLVVMASAGSLWAQRDGRQWPDAVWNFAGEERVKLTGVVSSLPELKARGKKVTVSLILTARTLSKNEKGRRRTFRVTGNVQTFLLQPSFVPETGDELSLYGKLEIPHKALNPGEFDYAGFLEQKDIRVVFQTLGARSVRRLAVERVPVFVRGIAGAREKIAVLIDRLYLPAHAAIMKALVIGVRTDVAPEVRDQFMKTGTVHLLAISGLNITMIAGSFFLVFLLFRLPRRASVMMTIFIVGAYVGLAGAGLPVQRAGYCAILALLGTLAGRPSNLLNALCFAFFLLVLWDPGSLWNIGFQLSFLSVFSLILIVPLTRRLDIASLSIGSSMAVLAGTFPLVIYYFNVFSPISVLANLVAIPVFDAALFTGLFTLLFCWVPFLNSALVLFSSWFLTMGLAWVKALSIWRWGYWFLEKPTLLLMVFYFASMACLLILRKFKFAGKKAVTGAVFIAWFALTVSFFRPLGPEGFYLTLLSGGKNQIAHARFSNGAHWLINTGRNFPSNQGEWLVAPYLRSRGIRSLEGILLTDLYQSRTGGLQSVMRDFPVRFLLYSGAFSPVPGIFWGILRSFPGKARSVRPGDRAVMGKASIEVVAQSRSGMAVKILSGPWRVMLISKLDSELFKQLIAVPRDGDVHAVFLPPEGRSVPGEFREWIRRTRPLLAVFPEPQPDLAGFLNREDVTFLDLKTTGALSFRENGTVLELESFLRGKLGFLSFS